MTQELNASELKDMDGVLQPRCVKTTQLVQEVKVHLCFLSQESLAYVKVCLKPFSPPCSQAVNMVFIITDKLNETT